MDRLGVMCPCISDQQKQNLCFELCTVLLLFLAAGLVIEDNLLVSAYYDTVLSMLCRTSHVLEIVPGEHAAILQLCWQSCDGTPGVLVTFVASQTLHGY